MFYLHLQRARKKKFKERMKRKAHTHNRYLQHFSCGNANNLLRIEKIF
jgi:hypothetical protein